VTKQIH